MKPFDAWGAFCAQTSQGGLRRAAVRGVGVSVLSQTTVLAIQMIATIILARLLTPADFGLVAIVTTFSLLLMNVGVNGFVEAVVQRHTIDHALASNLFWINLGLSLALAIMFAAAGGSMARLYGDPRIAHIALAVSLTIVFAGASGLHIALLKRSLSFSLLSATDVFARMLAVAVSILLAWAACGYWALVASTITISLVTCVGAWIRCQWVPGLPRRGAGTGAMVRFAVNTFGHFAANYCTRNLDNLLVGWFFGPQSLGLYKKAYDLCLLPVSQLAEPLHNVAVPTLSRLTGDPERHLRWVLRTLSTIAFVGMGVSGALTLIGQDLVRVLLGPRWEESGRIFSFFAPGIGAMVLYLTYGWIHLSLGRPDRLFRWGVIEFTVTGILFLVGLPWGPAGVALAWVVSFWTLTIPALWYAGRPASIATTSILGAVWRYPVAAAAACGGAAIVLERTPFLAAGSTWLESLARCAAASLMFAGLYLAAVVLLHGGFAPLRQLAALGRDLLPRRLSPSFPAPVATL